jgi:hypothetical protein
VQIRFATDFGEPGATTAQRPCGAMTGFSAPLRIASMALSTSSGVKVSPSNAEKSKRFLCWTRDVGRNVVAARRPSARACRTARPTTGRAARQGIDHGPQPSPGSCISTVCARRKRQSARTSLPPARKRHQTRIVELRHSSVLTAGKCAVRIRITVPLDSRSATCRCSRAARYSSCDQFGATRRTPGTGSVGPPPRLGGVPDSRSRGASRRRRGSRGPRPRCGTAASRSSRSVRPARWASCTPRYSTDIVARRLCRRRDRRRARAAQRRAPCRTRRGPRALAGHEGRVRRPDPDHRTRQAGRGSQAGAR